MKQDWHPNELAQDWTLSTDECELLGNKTGSTRLGFAVLLNSFQVEGRFPETREEVAGTVVRHLAVQTGVPPGIYLEDTDWSDTSALKFVSTVASEFSTPRMSPPVEWLSERVTSPNPDSEELRMTAYEHLREQHMEPPGLERLRRLLTLAVAQREEWLVADTAAQLSPTVCNALDALVKTETTEPTSDGDQMALFPVRSDFATVKIDAGAVSVETVLGEIAKLQQLRGLGLPENLFRRAAATLPKFPPSLG